MKNNSKVCKKYQEYEKKPKVWKKNQRYEIFFIGMKNIFLGMKTCGLLKISVFIPEGMKKTVVFSWRTDGGLSPLVFTHPTGGPHGQTESHRGVAYSPSMLEPVRPGAVSSPTCMCAYVQILTHQYNHTHTHTETHTHTTHTHTHTHTHTGARTNK
jgi:hypothetical protein